jgi:hypothetical protein
MPDNKKISEETAVTALASTDYLVLQRGTANYKFNVGASSLIDKKYVATLVQSGTSAPVGTILKSTLSGTPVLARASANTYTITLADEFTSGKTDVRMIDTTDVVSVTVTSTSVITLVTNADSVLNGHRIEILIYG